MRYLSFIFFLLFFLNAQSQRIRDFSVHDVGNGSVLVKFTVSAGPDCYGYDVLHSADSGMYNSVFNFPTQCGSNSEPTIHTWTHSSPVRNQTNYYKIQMLSPYEVSEVKRLYVSEPGRSQTIPFPNPVIGSLDLLQVKVPNAGNVQMVGYVYNRFGTSMQELDLRSHADLVSINIGGLGDGLYVVWLTDGTNLFTCKFIVER